MRAYVFLLLAAVALVGLVACGSEDPADPQAAGNSDATTTPTPDVDITDEGEDEDDSRGTEEEPSDDPAEPGDSSEPDGTDSASTEREGPGPIAEPGTQEVRTDDFPGGGGGIARLRDVRVGAHQGFDRIVLEFAGEEPPSYRVRYVEPPVRQDGSGNEVEVAGKAFLELRLTPATGHSPGGDATYRGPSRLNARNARAVTEVVRTGDFEANLAWVAGVDRRRPFAVAFLEDPLRLVVDVVTK